LSVVVAFLVSCKLLQLCPWLICSWSFALLSLVVKSHLFNLATVLDFLVCFCYVSETVFDDDSQFQTFLICEKHFGAESLPVSVSNIYRRRYRNVDARNLWGARIGERLSSARWKTVWVLVLRCSRYRASARAFERKFIRGYEGRYRAHTVCGTRRIWYSL